MKPAYTALGKEVLHNGAHHADAATPEAAKQIAAALNFADAIEWSLRAAPLATPTNTDTARVA